MRVAVIVNCLQAPTRTAAAAPEKAALARPTRPRCRQLRATLVDLASSDDLLPSRERAWALTASDRCPGSTSARAPPAGKRHRPETLPRDPVCAAIGPVACLCPPR